MSNTLTQMQNILVAGLLLLSFLLLQAAPMHIHIYDHAHDSATTEAQHILQAHPAHESAHPEYSHNTKTVELKSDSFFLTKALPKISLGLIFFALISILTPLLVKHRQSPPWRHFYRFNSQKSSPPTVRGPPHFA